MADRDLAGFVLVVRFGFFAVGLIGLLIWFVCLYIDLEKDAAVGSGWAPELIARQYEARERMSAEERRSWRHEQSLGLQSLRFFRHLGIGLTLIGAGGFFWFQI